MSKGVGWSEEGWGQRRIVRGGGGSTPDTGFSGRPALTGEAFVWDAKEHAARYGLAVDDRTTVLPNLLNSANALVTRVFDVTDIASATKVTAGLWETRIPDTSGNQIIGDALIVDAGADITMIFAGRYLAKTAADTSASAFSVGAQATNQLIGLWPNVSGDESWHSAIWAGGVLKGAAARKVDGDVVLLSYDHAASTVTLWVNGTKYGPAAGVCNLPPSRRLSFCGVDNTRFGNFDHGYAAIANTTLDDTAAAAWTAWLQERYSIPAL